MSHPVPAELQRLIEEATAGLDAAARGVPVCVATKAGKPAPGVKYHEGRWAALTEVARRFASVAGSSGLVGTSPGIARGATE